MPTRKAEPRKVWTAELILEVEKIAFTVQYVEQGKGSQTKRFLVPTDWLATDKEIILFNTGKRLKGWFKEQGFTLGGETKRDLIAFGMNCTTTTSTSMAPYEAVGKVSDFTKSRTWESFVKKGDYVLNGFPEPEVENMQTEHGSVFALWFILAKESPMELHARINSFARGLDHDLIKDWMIKLGQIKGLGDKHSSSDGYGVFKVKEFKVISEEEIRY